MAASRAMPAPVIPPPIMSTSTDSAANHLRLACRVSNESEGSTSVSASANHELPSTWFLWHAELIGPGMRILDVACGKGRHAMAAAARGAEVLAVDSDAERLKAAEKTAKKAQLQIDWRIADLQQDLPDGPFDMVMVFNYLDRSRMSKFLEMVRPGGYFLAETFLEQQRELGWGPTDDEHLLRPGELWSLVEPFEIVLARDVLEVLDGRPMAVASVLARRPQE